MKTIRLISQDGAVDIRYESYSVIIIEHISCIDGECTAILAYDGMNPDIVYLMGMYRSAEEAFAILENLRDKVSDSEECNTIYYFRFPKDSQSGAITKAIMEPYIKKGLWK